MTSWLNSNIYFTRTLAPSASVSFYLRDATLTDDNGLSVRQFAEPKGLRNMTILNTGTANIQYNVNGQGLRLVPAGVIDDRSEQYANQVIITNLDAVNNATFTIQFNNEQTELSVLKRLAGGGAND